MLDMEKIHAAAAKARYTTDPTDQELLDAATRKSLPERMAERLQKAQMSAALKQGKPTIPQGMKFGGGGVQGHVAKPPAGFTPIPHSKKGGYHKPTGGGKYVYWYPGQGIVGEKHEADADATPHQEATAKHVMDQILALEQKGKVTSQDIEHTQQAIRNAWDSPKDVPPKIMQHYRKLQQMAQGGGGQDTEVKIKEPGKVPRKPEGKEAAKDVEKQVKASKKEARSFAQEARGDIAKLAKQDKVARAEKDTVTDPKKVPKDFNKLTKLQRAKMTANWTLVEKDLEEKYTKQNYLDHPDMAQAVIEHIDEMAELGHIVPANTGRAKGMLLTQLKYGEEAGIPKETLAQVLEENVRKLAHQEIESVKRTLGDHGVRHLAVNAHQANRIFDQLEKGGVKVTPMDRFMSGQVMIDHDMGYTIPVIAKGGFAIKDNYHPQASAVLAKQQGAKYRKIFGKDGFKDYLRHVETHSGSGVDWKNDPVGSAVRLADNTHLFADKMPEVLFDTNAGIEVMTKIKLADQVVPKSLETVDDEGNRKMERTPEEKEKFKALIGGIKQQLADAIKDRKDLPESTKKLLSNAVSEIGALTPKFLISRLAGREPQFEYDAKSGDMKVKIEQSPAREAIGQIFGDDETDKQFTKMLKDFGSKPADAFQVQPPPQAKVRVGEDGNGIDFSWDAPTGEHPTEKRYAQVMKDTKARLDEIQAMKGPAKASAIKRFFGSELKKALDIMLSQWALNAGMDELEKSVGDRIKTAFGRRPPGAGWTPVPGGAKGGYRKMQGGKWTYWYPGMGKRGASKLEAERHQAKKELAHHEKQVAKWQEKHAKRREQGNMRGAEMALEQRDHHVKQAEKIRTEHGIHKAKEEAAMKKTVKVNRCTVHLGPDEVLAKSLEDGDLGIGTVPRMFSSKVGLKKSVVGGEGFTERGGDVREAVARQQQDELILRDDPAGNCGNGGLDAWFSDAQKTQEPAVRTPAIITKGMDQDRVNVVDDSDPYTRRLHQADPRTKSAVYDLDLAFNRDSKRTQ